MFVYIYLNYVNYFHSSYFPFYILNYRYLEMRVGLTLLILVLLVFSDQIVLIFFPSYVFSSLFVFTKENQGICRSHSYNDGGQSKLCGEYSLRDQHRIHCYLTASSPCGNCLQYDEISKGREMFSFGEYKTSRSFNDL